MNLIHTRSMTGGAHQEIHMSKWKWMLGSVPLALLALTPVAVGEEASGSSGEVPVAVPECAPDQRATQGDAQRIKDLQAEVSKLQAELAARSASPQYLDQDDPMLP
jgi:hypothetical protein